MKNLFDAKRYRAIADELAELEPAFDRNRFLRAALDGLDEREIMDRVRHTAAAFDLAHPGDYRRKVATLVELSRRGHLGFLGIWPSEFVARFGLDDPAFSLAALRPLTCYGSAEFAVRPFLVRDQAGTLKIMRGWADDENEHVRRLASEGSRPRLPWGPRLPSLVADPRPTLPILEALRADPSLYVRKSVANHLNDITKDHPELALDVVSAWDRSDARTAWIVKHALRTLIKRGHSRALTLFGAGEAPKVRATLAVLPSRIRLGDTISLAAKIVSDSSRPQTLIVDYVIHYPRETGRVSEKVFKWTSLELAGGDSIEVARRQTIRDFTTRKHHAGRHRVELQINGRRVAETSFSLVR